jgi:acetoin utilization protein AcuA
MMVVHPQIEEKIVYMVGYSWTWDLNGTGKTAQQYRQMLINLFKPQGFKEYQTNEPNICLKSENLFMCRVGNNIRQVILDRFKWLRFGLSPWAWKVS